MQGAQLFGEAGRLLAMRYGAKANGLAAWAAAMLMHESADGSSNVAKSCNNYGGITFAGQKGAVKCDRAQSTSEGGLAYAGYPNFGKFLADYVRILKLNRSGQGAPWSAKNLREFVTRLKLNGYFGDSIDNYYNALAAKLKKYFRPAAAKASVKTAQQERGENKGAKLPQMMQAKQVRDQRQKKYDEQEARKRDKSLQVWFENLSSLNKALVIGVGGYLVTKILDR